MLVCAATARCNRDRGLALAGVKAHWKDLNMPFASRPHVAHASPAVRSFLTACGACVLALIVGTAIARADDAADWKACTSDKADDVIASCTRLIGGKLDGKNQAIALGNRGWGYNQKGDFDKALADYTACLKVAPTDDYCLTELSDTYNLRKEYDKAIEAADSALKNNPKSEYANYNKGYALYKKADYDHAIASFSTAADLNPRYGKAYYQRGQAEAYKNDFAAAMADDNKALAINASDDDARAARGFAELNTGKLDAAQADLDTVISRSPRDAWSLGTRGAVYMAKGDDGKALADFDKALEIDTSADWMYTPRGLAKFHLKKFAEAVPDFQHVLVGYPGSIEANAYLGLSLVETGKKDDAKAPLHSALDSKARNDDERKAQKLALDKLTELGGN